MANKSKLTLAEALASASAFLQGNDYDEASAQALWALVFDVTLTDMTRALREFVDLDALGYFEDVLRRLVAGEPLQYILGRADFMGESFVVNEHALIPREETGGIIQLAQDYLGDREEARILDIGTGTGILAIMLKKFYPNAKVTGTDLSQEALEVARQNGQKHHVAVSWWQGDLLKGFPETTFDLIVSNPPYIGYHEQAVMDAHVLNFEPTMALFADNEGYAIYERLARQLPAYLKPKGQVILEMGYQQGARLQQLMQEAFPNRKIEVIQDYNQRDRYVRISEEGTV